MLFPEFSIWPSGSYYITLCNLLDIKIGMKTDVFNGMKITFLMKFLIWFVKTVEFYKILLRCENI